jgi:hypothetical protein
LGRKLKVSSEKLKVESDLRAASVKFIGFRDDGRSFHPPYARVGFDPVVYERKELKRVLRYLRGDINWNWLYSTMHIDNVRCPTCGKRYRDPGTYFTDGEFVWPVTLGHQVQAHGFPLPEAFRAKMAKVRFMCPKIPRVKLMPLADEALAVLEGIQPQPPALMETLWEYDADSGQSLEEQALVAVLDFLMAKVMLDLKDSTDIFFEGGVDGIDGDLFFIRFESRFGIDMAGFDYEKYYTADGDLLNWPKALWQRITKGRQVRYALTAVHLRDVVVAGKWFDPE